MSKIQLKVEPWNMGDGYTARLGSMLYEHQRLKPMHERHFLELEAARDPFLRPDIDYTLYIGMESFKDFSLFVLDYGEEPVGNMGVRFSEHPHHRKMVAAEDFFYIEPEHRKGMLASKFVRWILGTLKGAGVYEFISGYLPSNDLSAFYRRLGFSLRAVAYSKVL